MKSVIYDSISDWLSEHRMLSQLVQMLSWAANPPIISAIILIFALALLWNLIKGIGNLIQFASLSIIRVPLKFLWGLLVVSFFALGKLVINRYAVINKGAIAFQEPKEVTILPEASSQVIELDKKSDKQERLVEITARLEALQKEQKDLLQEAATLMISHQVETPAPNPQSLRLGVGSSRG
jgi:hypothetical protein